MKTTRQIFILMALAYTGLSYGLDYRTEGNSIIIPTGDQTLKLTLIDDHIMRVERLHAKVAVQEMEDYVTILAPQEVSFSTTTQDDNLIVRCAHLKARVNAAGELSFEDGQGKFLTQELPAGSRITKGEGTPFEVVQEFSVGDEALYGLGQYQSGIMNWKNTPLRMSQYNQEIVIPFLLSTQGYGIYWNNYSVTDFNRPANQLPLVSGQSMSFTPEQSGEYCFFVETQDRRAGHVQVKIDDDAIINYTTTWMPQGYSGKKFLQAGQSYTVSFLDKQAATSGKLFYNAPDFNKTTFSSKYGDKIDYYIISGGCPAEVLSSYSDLTGKAPLFDKSAFGFWQCRERYKTQEELLENAREMRKRKIPFDNIVQDWCYWQNGIGPDWHEVHYPQPQAMVEELSAMHVNLMVSVWPRVKHDAFNAKYGFKGHHLLDGFLDVYSPEVQKQFYKMLSDTMYGIGVKSIWLDGTEPQTMPPDDHMTAAGPFGRVANPYSLLVNKGVYEGHRQEFPDKRLFNLTRSAYAGQQRYGACSWSGDVLASWEQFAEQIPAGLNFTMAGIPYWTTDIGGFFRDKSSINSLYDSQYTNKEYIELLTRWFQFGTFNPIFRIHGYVSNTEIWRYGEEFETIARKFIDLRYALLPYIYSQSWKVYSQGAPMFAPLAYHYPEDRECWGIKDQFFLGDSLLVNPVTQYKARERELYLPQGEWYDFWTHVKLRGGSRITASAPIDSLPLYVKAGSIIPLGPLVSYATEPSEQPLKIVIYPGKDADYTLYLDDNEGNSYEKGEYATLVFHYSQDEGSLSISLGQAPYFEEKLKSMDLLISSLEGETCVPVHFTGQPVKIKVR